MGLKAKTVLQEGIWFPSDISFYWTPRVLCCRSGKTGWDFYEVFLDIVNEVREVDRLDELSSNVASDSVLMGGQAVDGGPIIFLPADSRSLKFQDIPQVCLNVASTYWRAVIVCGVVEDDADELLSEVEEFQLQSFARGLGKASVVVCEAEWSEGERERFERSCEERNILVHLIRLKSVLHLTSASNELVHDGLFRERVKEFVNATQRVVLRQISARIESDAVEQDVMMSQNQSVEADQAATSGSIGSSLGSGGGIFMQRSGAEITSAARRRQNADAKLRKQRGDCALLLNDPLAALTHYTAAGDSYRHQNDLLGQAVCAEGVAACLVNFGDTARQMAYRASPATTEQFSPTTTGAGMMTPTTPGGGAHFPPPHTGTSPTSSAAFEGASSLPPPIECIVKETLMPRRGGASTLLQAFFVQAEPRSSMVGVDYESVGMERGVAGRTEHRSNRRSSFAAAVASSSSVTNESATTLLLASAMTKLKEAAALYRRLKPDPAEEAACISNLTAASLAIEGEDRLAALEVLHQVTEEALSLKSALMPYITMACAAVYWKLSAPRKYVATLQSLNARLIELAGRTTGGDMVEDQETWRLIHRCSLLMSPWLHMPAATFLDALYYRQPSLEYTVDLDGESAFPTLETIVKSIRSNLALCAGHRDILRSKLLGVEPISEMSAAFIVEHLDEASTSRNSLPSTASKWPALQATTFDRLRKAADRLGLHLHTLRYSYAGLIILYSAFDARSQTSAQRLLAVKELQLSVMDRLRSTADDKHSSNLSAIQTASWMVPPSLTIVSPVVDKCQSEEWTYRKVKQLGAVTHSSVRRFLIMPPHPKARRCRKHNISCRQKGGANVAAAAAANASEVREYRFTTIGGLGSGHYPYVPHVCSLIPLENRRVDSVVYSKEKSDAPTGNLGHSMPLGTVKSKVIARTSMFRKATTIDDRQHLYKLTRDRELTNSSAAPPLPHHNRLPLRPDATGDEPLVGSATSDSATSGSAMGPAAALESEKSGSSRDRGGESPGRLSKSSSMEIVNDDIFLYQPWNEDSEDLEKCVDPIYWAVGDLHSVSVYVRNPLSIDILLDHCRLVMEGADAECQPLTVGLPPSGNNEVPFDALLVPQKPGPIYFLGLSYLASRVSTAQCLFWDSPILSNTLFTDDFSEKQQMTESVLEDILRESAIASVLAVPPLPVLQLLVKEIQPGFHRRSYKKILKSLTSIKSSSLDRFRLKAGRSFAAVPLSYNNPGFCYNVPYAGQYFALELTLHNTSSQYVDELWLLVGSDKNDRSSRRRTVVPIVGKSSQVIFESAKFASTLRFRHKDRILEWRSLEADNVLNCFRDCSPASDLTTSETLKIGPGVTEVIYLEGIASSKTASFLTKALYTAGGSQHLREDSWPLNVGFRDGLQIDSGTLRLCNDYQIPLSDLLRRSLTSGRFSTNAKKVFNWILRDLSNPNDSTTTTTDKLIFSFDNPNALLLFQVINKADVAFLCHVLGPTSLLQTTPPPTPIKPNEYRRKLVVKVRRGLTEEELAKYRSLVELCDAHLSLYWTAEPDLMGRLFFGDADETDESVLLVPPMQLLMKPRVEIKTEMCICGAEEEVEWRTEEENSIRIKCEEILRIRVSMLASEPATSPPALVSYIIPYATDLPSVMGPPDDRYMVAGSLEKYLVDGWNSVHQVAIIPMVPGPLQIAVLVLNEATNILHCHHKSLSIEVVAT